MNPRSTLRSILYQTEKLAQRARFASLPEPGNGWPILLGISFPKSGTHLLDQILLGFAKVAPFAKRLHSFYAEYEGESGQKRTPDQALAWLSALHPLDVASAHLFARPEILARVKSSAYVPYFIFRDPRDVVVSHVYYVTDMEARHVHHDHYQSLPDFDARLKVSILGRPGGRSSSRILPKDLPPTLDGWVSRRSCRSISRISSSIVPVRWRASWSICCGAQRCPPRANRCWRQWSRPSIPPGPPPSDREKPVSGKNTFRPSTGGSSRMSPAIC